MIICNKGLKRGDQYSVKKEAKKASEVIFSDEKKIFFILKLAIENYTYRLSKEIKTTSSREIASNPLLERKP